MLSLQVDNLIHHVKELQREKYVLEQKLDETKAKNEVLEKDNDQENSKYILMKDTHRKMEETLEIAKHKVGQSQMQVKSLENSNNEIRKVITEKEKELTKEGNVQDQNRQTFEESLAGVAENLKRAKVFYDDHNLKNELATMDLTEADLLTELESLEKEEKELIEARDTIRAQKEALSTCEDALTEAERIQIWKQLDQYRNFTSVNLDKVKAELDDLTKTDRQLLDQINLSSSDPN